MMDGYFYTGDPEQGEAGAGLMPGYLEAAIPILWGGQTLGVLDLISSRSASNSNGQPFNPFSSRSLAELQKIADVIALAMAALSPRLPASAAEAEASQSARPEPVPADLTADPPGASRTAQPAVPGQRNDCPGRNAGRGFCGSGAGAGPVALPGSRLAETSRDE